MIIYTDGSCIANGRPNASGGFAIVGMEDNKCVYAYSKQNENTTNNREELRAILRTMLTFGVNINNCDWSEAPTVYSDSSYCVNTFNDWMFRWAVLNWVKSDGKTPENLDLIQAYFEHYQKGYRIDLRKIKGHAGHLGNEIADKLATGKLTPEEALKIYG